MRLVRQGKTPTPLYLPYIPIHWYSNSFTLQDKAPAPLNQLDVLLEDTYGRLMAEGTLLETAQVGSHVKWL